MRKRLLDPRRLACDTWLVRIMRTDNLAGNRLFVSSWLLKLVYGHRYIDQGGENFKHLSPSEGWSLVLWYYLLVQEVGAGRKIPALTR